MLSETVHYLKSPTNQVGNPSIVLCATPSGTLMIDAGVPGDAPAIRAYLEDLSIEPPSLLLNTHAHLDHTHGNQEWAEGATIFARPRVRAQMMAGGRAKPAGYPDVTFEGPMSFFLDEETVVVLDLPHTSGHTGGDAAVHLPTSDVLVTGDYYFVDRLPIVDLDGGGDLEGYLENVRFLLEHAGRDTQIVPGHPNLAGGELRARTRAEYEAWYEDVQRAVEFVAEAQDRGQSAGEILEAGWPEALDYLVEQPRFVSPEAWVGGVFEYRHARR